LANAFVIFEYSARMVANRSNAASLSWSKLALCTAAPSFRSTVASRRPADLVPGRAALQPVAITLGTYQCQVVLESADRDGRCQGRIVRRTIHLHRRLARDVDRDAAIVSNEDLIRLEEYDVVAIGGDIDRLPAQWGCDIFEF
jgi:hypothetical protein